MTLEIAGICFGLSAFLRGGSAAVGLGVAVLFYMMNIFANITEKAEFLKYLTPFAYCDGGTIVEQGGLDWPKVAIGLGIAAAAIIAAFVYYPKKDIH